MSRVGMASRILADLRPEDFESFRRGCGIAPAPVKTFTSTRQPSNSQRLPKARAL